MAKRRVADRPTGDSYFLVLDDGGPAPALHKFATLEQLAGMVRQLPKTVAGYMFVGRRVQITADPWRYLIDGQRAVPLFDPPDGPGDVDDSPFLGAGAEEGNPADRGTAPRYRELVAGLNLAGDDLPDVPPDDDSDDDDAGDDD